MVEKVYVVMRDCDYEGDYVVNDKFYLSEEEAQKVADSLIERTYSGRIIDYYYVSELTLALKGE